MKSAGFAVLEDYGPFAIVEGSQSDVAGLQATTGLAFDRDDDAFLIRLGGIAIDTSPAALPPDLDKDLQLSDYDEPTGLYVLQFHGPLRPEWLNLLSAAGVRPIQYVGSHAYSVAAPHGLTALRARFKAPVQYVGVLQPAFKLAPGVRAMDPSSAAEAPMTAILDGGQDLSTVLATLASIDIDMHPPDGARGGQQRVRFSATASQARALARSAAVLWIEPVPDMGPSDERADQLLLGNISGGQPTNPGGYGSSLSSLGLGTGVLSSEIVDVLDTGVELSNASYSATCITPTASNVGHPDLNNSQNNQYQRLAYACPSSPNDSNNINDGPGHGTLVASIMAGDPVQPGGAFTYFTLPDSPKDSGTFFWDTGVAPGMRFGSTKLFDNNGSPFKNRQSLSTLANTAYVRGARYQNSSWNNTDDSYSSDSHDYDLIVRNAGSGDTTHSMAVVFSSGNYPQRRLNTNAPATAKNVITVGASGVLRTDVGGCNSTIGINDVTSFSSRGAAYNSNLFKPDLVAPGQVMLGGLALDAINHTLLNDCYGTVTPLPNTGQHSAGSRGLYYPVRGTSYSAPQVTGAAVLVKKVLGSVAPSLIKATLVANAESMHGGTDRLSGATLGWEPSPIQGWGRLSLKRFFDGTPRVYATEYAPWAFTATGQSMYFTLTVADPAKPVLVSLAWTDPPGQPGSSNPLVNSLALYVYHGNDLYCDGLNYYGGQYHTPQSMCWLAPDSVNNVKMIRIAPNTFPPNGQFTIQIYAVGINGFPANQDWSAYAYNAR